MSQTESELAMNAFLLGIHIAEHVHKLPHGSTAELSPEALQDVAEGRLVFTASGAEIRQVFPQATEADRNRSANGIQQAARLVLSRHKS